MNARDPFGWIGHTLEGKISVEAVAGEGGFGVVYRGTHLGFAEPVAIKFLKLPAELPGPEREAFLAAFLMEARVLRKLCRASTKIVEALDVGAAVSPNGTWTPYLTMEWLEGESLEAGLARAQQASLPPLGLSEAAVFLAPVADALSIAHELGVAHRDVKPANLFLAQMGATTVFKVVDFGIAKLVSEGNARDVSFAAFSPQWSAPEQFQPALGDTGPWTDVFAFALVLLELVTGRRGLEGSTFQELFESSVRKPRPTFAGRGVEASEEAERVLARALAVDPKNRHRSMREFFDALRGVIGMQGAPAEAMTIPWATVPTSSSPPPAAAKLSPSSFAETMEGAFDATMRPAEHLLGARTSTRTSLAVPGGQRRLCTVVAVDLGLAALADHPDADADAAKILLDAEIASVVEALGGGFEPLTDEVSLGVFGAARSHENDPERAVTAGLRIVERIVSLVAKHGELAATGIHARVGVQTGIAIADDALRVTQRTKVRGPVVQESTQLALRAPDDGVVIGAETQRHVESLYNVEAFTFTASGTRREAQAFLVTSASTVRAPLPRSDFYGLPTQFIGRDAELDSVTSAVEACVRDDRGVRVDVTARQGLGRSRLLAELLARLARHPRPHFVVVGRAIDLESTTPYALLAALFRRRFALPDFGEATENAARVVASIQKWLGDNDLPIEPWRGVLRDEDLASDALVVAELCSGRRDVSPDSAMGHEGELRTSQRVTAAVARLLSAVARAAPVVVLVDDLHGADEASKRLLEALLERLEGLPVAIVTTRRVHEGVPHEVTAPGALSIELPQLDTSSIEALARDRLREVVPLDDDFVRDVVERASGNPFVLAETLQLCVDAGVIERSADGIDEPWRLRRSRSAKLALPDSLRGLFQARLDRLDDIERHVLVLASVFGDVFWQGGVEQLRTVSPHAAVRDMGLFAPQLSAVLERLRAKRILGRREPAAFPGEREYAFVEPVMRAVAYDTIHQRLRRPYNELAAEWLSPRAQSDARADRIALHWELAGRTARAVMCFVRAAEHAAGFGQNEDAKKRYESALELLEAEAGRARSSASLEFVPIHELARLRLGYGDILHRLGELGAAERAYIAGRDALPATAAGGDAASTDTEALSWHARFELRLALVCRVRGDNVGARELIERALSHVRLAKSPMLEASAQQMLASVLQRERDAVGAGHAARAGLALCRFSPASSAAWHELTADLLSALGSSFRMQRKLVRAERCYRQAARIAERSEGSRALSFALNDLGGIRYLAGDLRGALPCFVRSLALKEREGDLLQVAIALNNVAEVELHLGESGPALEHAQRAVLLGERVSATSELPDMYKNLALASLASSDYTRALDAAERGLELASTHHIATYLPESALAAARVVTASVESGDASIVTRATALALRVVAVARGRQEEPLARARELLSQFSS